MKLPYKLLSGKLCEDMSIVLSMLQDAMFLQRLRNLGVLALRESERLHCVGACEFALLTEIACEFIYGNTVEGVLV